MIEVVHFQNRFGKQVVGVIDIDRHLFATPSSLEHAERYAAGLEKPYYPVPVPIEHSHAFAIHHCLQLIAEIWSDQSFGGDHA